jgi:lysophospholipase L1-like esterase
MRQLGTCFAFAICIALGLTIASTCTVAEEPAKPWTFDPAALKPFWRSDVMDGESVLFMSDNASSAPKATLLFVPTKITAVRNSAGNVTYEEGRDYLWTPGTRTITLPKDSRIVHKTPKDLRRPPKTQQFSLTHRDGNGEILFGATHEYHDMQTSISYTHPIAWTGATPSFASNQLPRTIERLKAKRPVAIALLGDSISTGCNASGWAKAAPFQPPFQDLFAMNLEAVYGAKVSLRNFAVGGTGSAWGVQTIGKLIDAKPDLVILAFGMNDAGGLPPAQYQANIRAMIDAVRKTQPQAEFILIASMLGNPDWVVMRLDRFPEYRDALRQLCGPGVALADMTSMWTEFQKHKKDWDMTGNGVNHPNDFGHRIYAQVLSTLLVEPKP